MDKRSERMAYETSCKKNPPYPRVRMLCNQVEQIADRDAVPEPLDRVRWLRSSKNRLGCD